VATTPTNNIPPAPAPSPAAAAVATAATAVISSSVARTNPQNTTANANTLQQAQQTQQNNNLKKLVDAMKGLTKSFTAKPPAASGAGAGKMGIFGSIGSSIKDMIGESLSPLKELKTKGGILKTLASVSGGGVLSTVLGGAAEKIETTERDNKEKIAEQKRKEKEKADEQKRKEKEKADWTSAYLDSTRGGKKLVKTMGAEGAEQEAAKLYEEKLALEKEVEKLKEKQKEKRAIDIIGSDLSKEEQKKLAASEKRLSILGGAPARVSSKTSVSPTPLDAPTVDAITPTTELTSAPASGALIGVAASEPFENLLKINENQLESLEKILDAVTVSDEDRLEARARGTPTPIGAASPVPGATPENKGLLQSLLENSGLGSLLTKGKAIGAAGMGALKAGGAAGMGALKAGGAAGMGALKAGGAAGMGALKAAAPIAAKMALPAAAVAGAGYAGYKTGGLLNEYVLNPAAEAITGQEGETLGGAVYSGVDKVKGMLGFQTDAKKMEMSERKAVEDLYNKQMMERGTVSPYLAKEMEKYGVKTPDTLIKTVTPATATPTPTPTTSKTEVPPAIDATPQVEAQPVQAIDATPPPIVSPVSSESRVDALAVSRAEEMTNTMLSKTDAMAEASAKKPIVVTVPTPMPSMPSMNTTTNTTIVRPDTRTPEPTFNKVLSRNFTFA
jgi:hypothetical protein